MASAVENFTFNELPRRLVVDSSLPTGSSLTAGWVLVASGVGFQAIPADPSLLGFEPTVAPATSDPTTKYYRGDKTWQTLNATAVGAIASSEKGIALGVATLDADGYVLLSQMNPSVIERVVIVADQAARYALTTLDVQNGDVVNQQSPSPATMWFVVDQDNLGNSGGYLPFSAGIAGSVAWSGVTGKPAIIGDLEDISLATEGDLIQFVSGNWVKVNAATLKTSLSIQTSDVSGLDTALGALQSSSDNLTAVTDLATDGIMVMTNAGTATAEVQAREITVSAPLEVTNGTGVDDNPNISLGESEVTAGTYGDDLNYATFEVTSKGLLRDAGVRSIERPSLIIPNATVDYYLSNRTRHILGVAGTYGALSLILPAGDTLQSGSWVEIIVNEDLVEFTDSVIISATGIQSVNNVSSINLVSYGLYPGSRIYCVYEHLSSEWVVTVNNNNTFRSLTVVNPASTDFNESHLIESAALQPRTVLLPDADVDLTKVSQAASTSTDGYLTSTDWNAFSSTEFIDSTLRIIDDVNATKKLAFEVSPITAANTRTITAANRDLDLKHLGDVQIISTTSSSIDVTDGSPSVYLFTVSNVNSRTVNLNQSGASDRCYEFRNGSTGNVSLTLSRNQSNFYNESGQATLHYYSAVLLPGESVLVSSTYVNINVNNFYIHYRKASILNVLGSADFYPTPSGSNTGRTIELYAVSSFNFHGQIGLRDVVRIYNANSSGSSITVTQTGPGDTTPGLIIDAVKQETVYTFTIGVGEVAEVRGSSGSFNLFTIQGAFASGRFKLIKRTGTYGADLNTSVSFNINAITQNRSISVPDRNVDLTYVNEVQQISAASSNTNVTTTSNPSYVYTGVQSGTHQVNLGSFYSTTIPLQFTNNSIADVTLTLSAPSSTFYDQTGPLNPVE